MLHARAVLGGGLVGGLLAANRVSRGFDAFSIPAVSGASALLARAIGLALIVFVLARTRSTFAQERRPFFAFLAGCPLGFTLWSLVSVSLPATGLAGATLTALVFAAIAWFVLRGEATEAGFELRDCIAGSGVAIAGLGLTLGFEGLARITRQLGTASSSEVDLFAVVFLASLAIGAVVFRSLLVSAKAKERGVVLFLAIAGALCWFSLQTVARLTTEAGWGGWVREYGMLPHHRGHVQYTLLLAGVTLALPAVALGAALDCMRRTQLVFAVAGAALGLAIAPQTLGYNDSELLTIGMEIHVLFGVGTLATGLAICAFTVREATLIERGACAALAGLVGVFPFLAAVGGVLPLSPWSVIPVQLEAAYHIPEGLLIIERPQGGVSRVSLDGRALAPGPEGAERDSAELDATLGLLSEERRSRGDLRMLLVGQLTPGRALGLVSHDVTRIDRTGAWAAIMPQVESELFANETLPRGDVLSMSEAKRRWNEGHYDLVWIPSVTGECPAIPEWSADSPSLAVAWFDAAAMAARRSLPERGLLHVDSPDRISIAFVSRPSEATGLRLGSPTRFDGVLDNLQLHVHQRELWEFDAFAERLRRANEGEEFAALSAAIAQFGSVQRESSPWGTPAEATEVDERSMELLCAAVEAHPKHAATRAWAESIGRVLIGKRRIDWLEEFLAPLAEAHAPWPELELLRAEAELEGLLYDRVLERLERLDSSDPTAYLLKGRALLGLGRDGEAWSLLAARSAAHHDPRGQIRDFLIRELVERHGEEALRVLAGSAPELAGNPDFRGRLERAVEDSLGHDHAGHDH